MIYSANFNQLKPSNSKALMDLNAKLADKIEEIGAFCKEKWPENLINSQLHYMFLEVGELKHAVNALDTFHPIEHSRLAEAQEKRLQAIMEAVDVFVTLCATLTHDKLRVTGEEFIMALEKKIEILSKREYVMKEGLYIRKDKLEKVTDKVLMDDGLDDEEFDLKRRLEIDDFE